MGMLLEQVPLLHYPQRTCGRVNLGTVDSWIVSGLPTAVARGREGRWAAERSGETLRLREECRRRVPAMLLDDLELELAADLLCSMSEGSRGADDGLAWDEEECEPDSQSFSDSEEDEDEVEQLQRLLGGALSFERGAAGALDRKSLKNLNSYRPNVFRGALRAGPPEGVQLRELVLINNFQKHLHDGDIYPPPMPCHGSPRKSFKKHQCSKKAVSPRPVRNIEWSNVEELSALAYSKQTCEPAASASLETANYGWPANQHAFRVRNACEKLGAAKPSFSDLPQRASGQSGSASSPSKRKADERPAHQDALESSPRKGPRRPLTFIQNVRQKTHNATPCSPIFATPVRSIDVSLPVSCISLFVQPAQWLPLSWSTGARARRARARCDDEPRPAHNSCGNGRPFGLLRVAAAGKRP